MLWLSILGEKNENTPINSKKQLPKEY